ncbi:hypothetical protein JCM10908_005263 [Rhodotorula pacifica]|uniref:uncharacterized protein n=1 Tax=Rhodotorula pacifica TaxID=1495444 RepID=UPI00317C57E1
MQPRALQPQMAELIRPLMAAVDDDEHGEDLPPPPPPRRPDAPRFSRPVKALITFYLLLWMAYTILLYFNRQISPDEARELAERYRIGKEDVYVRTNVVFGADGTVLHEGRSVISLHTIAETTNVTLNHGMHQ